MPDMGMKVASRHRSRGGGTGRAPGRVRTGLVDALFSSTQQRVLALLFGQPERSFFTTELIGLVGAGSGAVQRELSRLSASGLARTMRVGNQKHYQANPDAPIFAELCALVEKTLGPAEVVRAALAELTDEIRLGLVYGSVATHADTAESDIDVLIVSETLTLERVYEAMAAAERRLGRRVSPTLYTSAEFRRRKAEGNPFLSKVLAREYILLTGDPDAA